jgi:hypothetical protein
MKSIFSLVLLFVFSTASWSQVNPALVGKYQMEVQGGDTLELRADGTATLAGDSMQWTANGRQLQVGPDVMAYVLQGDRLIVQVGAVQLVWKRMGKASSGMSPMAKAASKANAPGVASATSATNATSAGNPQDAQARQLLTSSAWCSFTYNQTSGTSTTRRVVFQPDGVMRINGGAETSSSGYGGSYAGQSASGAAMLWKVENLRLLIDQQKGAGFQDIGLSSSKNSNGYPILHADGREYAMCN